MRDKTGRNYRKHAGNQFGLLRKVWRGKSGAGLAASFPGAESYTLPVRRQDSAPIAPVRRLFLIGLLGAFFAASLSAQSQGIPDFTAITLEDLMNMQVTSVSKRTQKLANAAAAIFVITQEDIRRSGASSVPEALRMAPGIEVARIDENKWAIGSRGFNGRFNNKLLVLIDGRSVYTPLFSGVYWNVQDVMLEDVDRIEVIRGPGATLWGANAVNGVINIITKPAKSTQSALLTAEAGTDERVSGSARFGGKFGHENYYRAYSKYFKWQPSVDSAGNNNADGWDTVRGGFRLDSSPSAADLLTLQGDLYRSGYGETLTVASLTPPYSSTFPNKGSFSGGNVLGRWNHAFTKSSTTLQTYFDKTNIEEGSVLTDHQNIFDIDFQNNIHVGDTHEILWGLGYRSVLDDNSSSFTVSLQPNHRSLNLWSAFVQDEVDLFDKRLHVTLGSKVEHNDFTGFELEPNARFLWTLTKDQSVWAAISRAVRTPAITEEGLQLNSAVIPPGTPPLPTVIAVFGSNQFKSEDLLAYELGYRVQATSSFSTDIAAFYNKYSDLRTAEPGSPFLETDPTPAHIVVPFVAGNKMSGGTYGVELFADWRVLPKWRLIGSYSFLQMNIRKNADSLDPTPDNPDGSSPSNQFYVRSSLDLPKKWEFDSTLRFVDSLPALNIGSYFSLDARLGWRPVGGMELSLGGQNLLNNKHSEFLPDFIATTPSRVARTVRGTITWRFE
jgi:iron complex outermembrane recepter protein